MAKQNYNKRPTITMLPDFGKVPPQANDLEEAVLGAVMIEKECIHSIIDIIKPESFYREAHQKIFAAVMALFKKNFPTDIFSVTEYLRSNNELDAVGGPLYITKLSSRVVSAGSVEYHSRIIAQKYIQRELIRVSTEIQTRSFDDSYDVSELLGYAEDSLMEISGRIFKKQTRKLGDVAYEVVDTIEKIQSGEMKLVGTPSGFTSLDRHTSGFRDKELTIIAARPSMGKTATAIQIAKNIAGFGKPVAFFSCEMTEQAITIRYLSGESGSSNNDIISAKCDIGKMITAAENLQNYNIYFDGFTGISVTEVRAKTRKLMMQYGIKAVIVDYLQLMTGEGDVREQQIAYISRGLKSIAQDFNIPVIALSQLSRKVDDRSDKKPILSDLRESGAIEQDADVVIFLHCPEKLGVREYEINNKTVDTRNLIIPIISKNRNGPTGELVWRRNDYFTQIFEEESIHEFPANVPDKSFSDTEREFEKSKTDSPF